MSRIAISIILAICVYSCLAFKANAEQGQSQIGKRNKRMTLGLSMELGECAHVGSSCYVQRDNANKPTTVTMQPCCDKLVCAGFGPTEQHNAFGQAVSSSDTHFSGICTLSLDNNQAKDDQDTYIAYVKEL